MFFLTCFLKNVYISAGQDNVIVCVLDALTDWDTAAAISFAKKHDLSGERTLYVITKIDRAESGLRQALDSLQRDHLRAQSSQQPMGYVMVRPGEPHQALGMYKL